MEDMLRRAEQIRPGTGLDSRPMAEIALLDPSKTRPTRVLNQDNVGNTPQSYEYRCRDSR